MKNLAFALLFGCLFIQTHAQFCIDLPRTPTEQLVAMDTTTLNEVILVTNLGNYYKVDATGAPVWGWNAGFFGFTPVDLIATRDGNFAILDRLGNIHRFDQTGAHLSTINNFGTPGLALTRYNRLLEAVNGDFVAVGFSNKTLGGNDEALVTRVTATGTPVFSTTVGGQLDDEATNLVELSNGRLLVLGFTNSFGAGGDDVYLFLLSATGNLLQTRTFGDVTDQVPVGLAALSSGYFVAEQQVTMRLNGGANLTSQTAFSNLAIFDFIHTINGRFALVGRHPTSVPPTRIWP